LPRLAELADEEHAATRPTAARRDFWEEDV
jgi:hypothetical protein